MSSSFGGEGGPKFGPKEYIDHWLGEYKKDKDRKKLIEELAKIVHKNQGEKSSEVFSYLDEKSQGLVDAEMKDEILLLAADEFVKAYINHFNEYHDKSLIVTDLIATLDSFYPGQLELKKKILDKYRKEKAKRVEYDQEQAGEAQEVVTALDEELAKEEYAGARINKEALDLAAGDVKKDTQELMRYFYGHDNKSLVVPDLVKTLKEDYYPGQQELIKMALEMYRKDVAGKVGRYQEEKAENEQIITALDQEIAKL